MLRRNDKVAFGDFQEFLRAKFSGKAGDLVSELENYLGDQSGEPMPHNLPEPGVPLAMPGPSREVSISSLEKGERREEKREERRKKRRTDL